MDFTREPIIETVITPKEGCKLVVRSSKNTGQEEYFVDAVEVVCFGSALFFRTLERPKAFLVPVSDYEVLEVREARMVLKNVGVERTIKIGGGKAPKEQSADRPEPVQSQESANAVQETNGSSEAKTEGKIDKKRDKRRHSRRRRGRDEGSSEETEGQINEDGEANPSSNEEKRADAPATPPTPPAILAPPSTLISETLARYKDNALFKGAFYTKEEQQELSDDSSARPHTATEGHPEDVLEAIAMQDVSLEPSEYGSLGLDDEIKSSEEDNLNWQLPYPEPELEAETPIEKREE